jgi:hypothetical protein
MADAVRVFVGCAANHEDLESQAVLEWSIRKHASLPVEITWMRQSNDPDSPFHGWRTDAWATPFTAFRWGIPAFCGYQGKAIYTDSDVIFMADIAELWSQQHPPGKMLLAKGDGQWRICVSMWDCAEAGKVLPDLPRLKSEVSAHQRCTALLDGRVAPFAGQWNCLDREIGGRQVTDPSIKAIHYTDMRSQPQLRHAVPRLQAEGAKHWFSGATTVERFPAINALFDEMLAEATANGYGVDRYAQAEKFGPYARRLGR